VQWSVLMLFMVLVGGLRSFEGPFVDALLLFALQEWLGEFGAWYLAGLGAVAVACALYLPRGLWGLARERLGWQLVATGARPPAAATPSSPLVPTLERSLLP
jgi:branched-chain amino acid transport system permease protein